MKNIIIAVLFVATIGLGAMLVFQKNSDGGQAAELAQAKADLANVTAELKQKTEAIENAKFAENKARILQDTLSATAASAIDQSNEVAQLQHSLANVRTNNNPFAEMFKDPQMKEMIRSQQKMVLGPMIDKTYGDLLKQLNLPAETSGALKEMLLEKMLVGAEMGMSMLDGSFDATKRAELAKKVKEDTEGFDNQIKELLGENHPAFEAYEKTTPDRMAVGQFREQIGSSPMALDADQERQMIQIMNEERLGFKWSTDYSKKNPGDADFMDIFTEDRMATFGREKEQFDRQYLNRIGQVLKPEQLAAYEEFQKVQRETQINGMKMAAKMFGAQGR